MYFLKYENGSGIQGSKSVAGIDHEGFSHGNLRNATNKPVQMIDFLLEIPLKKRVEELSGLFKKKPHFEYSYSNENLDLLAWGDPIPDENNMNNISDTNLIDTVLNHY